MVFDCNKYVNYLYIHVGKFKSTCSDERWNSWMKYTKSIPVLLFYDNSTYYLFVRMSSKSVRYLSCACYLFILVILEKTIRIPRSLSVKAAGILKGFLNKNPTDRLGCHKESRFMEIQTHPFFKSIEWEAVSFQRPFKQILLNLGYIALLILQ